MKNIIDFPFPLWLSMFDSGYRNYASVLCGPKWCSWNIKTNFIIN